MNRPHFLRFFIGLGIVVLLQITNSRLEAQTSFNFTRIADTAPSLGDNQSFSNLGQAVIDGDRVAFTGTSGGNNGIFTTNNGSAVETAIDENSLFFSPGSTFRNLSISGDQIAFNSTIPRPLPSGLFVQDVATGSLRNVVNFDDPFPGSNSRNFDIIGRPSISNGTVAFAGDDFLPSFPRSVFVDSSFGPATVFEGSVGLEKVVDVRSFDAGSEGNISASGLANVVADGSDVYFSTLSSRGLYVRGSDGLISPVISPSDTEILPLSSGISGLSVSDGNIAFDAGDSGIATIIDGQLSLAVTRNTPIPNSDDTFASLDDVAIDGENIAFFGTDSFNTGSTAGLYARIDGEFLTIFEEGDLLDGRVISELELDEEGFSDDQIVFTLGFRDGTEAVFLASVNAVPEPTAVLPIILCLSSLMIGRRRSK